MASEIVTRKHVLCAKNAKQRGRMHSEQLTVVSSCDVRWSETKGETAIAWSFLGVIREGPNVDDPVMVSTGMHSHYSSRAAWLLVAPSSRRTL
jgi:hypothetical protein